MSTDDWLLPLVVNEVRPLEGKECTAGGPVEWAVCQVLLWVRSRVTVMSHVYWKNLRITPLSPLSLSLSLPPPPSLPSSLLSSLPSSLALSLSSSLALSLPPFLPPSLEMRYQIDWLFTIVALRRVLTSFLATNSIILSAILPTYQHHPLKICSWKWPSELLCV